MKVSRRFPAALFASALFVSAAAHARAASTDYTVTEKSVAALAADLANGKVTSEALVRVYLARIASIDDRGPALHSIIALNPRALEEARARDAARRAGEAHGPLFGIPVLVKDNIETASTRRARSSSARRIFRSGPTSVRTARSAAGPPLAGS